MFKGKKILLGITGSIAAYKSISLLRLLTSAGAEVKVILTPSAKLFVSPLTLSTLSGNAVLENLFDENTWSNHVMLGRWADVMVIAPLSCNTLAKMANGICDNLLLATYLSATCPVMVSPAMDEDMWMHPSTKSNLEKLKSFRNVVLPVGSGPLASGLSGPGRMLEPEELVDHIKNHLSKKSELTGKSALVTAGPTYEALDPVRFIGNHSSGKMGIALAEELRSRGAKVTLVLGPSSEKVPVGIEVIHVVSAAEMYEQSKVFFSSDILIMAAAVADYKPVNKETEKIKKKDEAFVINLSKTTDILKEAGKVKTNSQVLVGFALETENEKQNALKKLEEKNADLIVLNSMKDSGAGFGKDTNKISIFGNNNFELHFEAKDKKLVAADIIDTLINYKNA